MKTTQSMKTAFVILLMIICNVNFGQEYIKLERKKSIMFADESKVAEVKINVTEEYNFLKIQIVSFLQRGEASFEIINPKGEVKGKYSIVAGEDKDIVKGENTHVESLASGEMERAYRNPEKGDWIVRIIPKRATGKTDIDSRLVFHPKADLLENDQIEDDSDSLMEKN
jgi:hypothetical protein